MKKNYVAPSLKCSKAVTDVILTSGYTLPELQSQPGLGDVMDY